MIHDETERRARQQQTARDKMKRFSWQAALGLALGMPLLARGLFGGSMSLTPETQRPWLVVGIITLAVMVFAGGHFYRNAWRALMNGSATMDTLVALGTAAAWLYSISVNMWPDFFPLAARHLYYEASAMIIGLINLGQALERLMDLTPPTARLVTENGERFIPLAEVQLGMRLRLTTGDRVPVDGEIVQGDVWLDEAMLTGEAVPQQRSVGDTVYAGTVVDNGSVLFRAAAIGSKTTLARITKLVRQAQSSKPEIGQLADRISAIFVPAVVVVALISATLWYFFGPQPPWGYTLVIATTVLIIACPCALGLATPMSIIAGVGRAAEFDVLVRDADALQQASQLDTLVFDKTGNLTAGRRPQVVEILTFNQVSEHQALSWAAALEQGSHHPLGRAIVERAAGQTLPQVEQFRTLRSAGISGEVGGVKLLLGNAALLQQHQIALDQLEVQIHSQAECCWPPIVSQPRCSPSAIHCAVTALRHCSASTGKATS